MTGKAGEEGHIRPEHGTDVLDRDAESGSDPAGGAPIFVDPSGRRASRMRRMGWLVAAGCVCSAATLGVAIADGNSTAPWLQIPGVLGGSSQNRSVDEAQQSQRPESGTPTADSPSSTAAGSLIRQPSADTAPEAMGGSPSKEKGSNTSAAEPTEAGASSKAGNTGVVPADEEEAVAAQPSRTASPDSAQEPTAAPSQADSTPPDTSAEPAPTETSSGGLLGGIGDIVTGLFGK
ncbi:hypothetical protein C6Y14_39055 [Streptomyces dioscori]|uniref:Uncharacterized protein n=1 Tax=Streptomyces dioscori TaxID=2109333 RepID=A0A2P8PVP1_9ACTN|nr:hypothetical protein [Streptomyces dioscori]PSM38080.1 hypothetical protein C6Y14_39055 [Streptomyces dioscori]